MLALGYVGLLKATVSAAILVYMSCQLFIFHVRGFGPLSFTINEKKQYCAFCYESLCHVFYYRRIK